MRKLDSAQVAFNEKYLIKDAYLSSTDEYVNQMVNVDAIADTLNELLDDGETHKTITVERSSYLRIDDQFGSFKTIKNTWHVYMINSAKTLSVGITFYTGDDIETRSEQLIISAKSCRYYAKIDQHLVHVEYNKALKRAFAMMKERVEGDIL